jgi:3'-phosphoadenosine 5'-phosphosulfate sulfotransferase (PAPS reductase)/FAD synthetase
MHPEGADAARTTDPELSVLAFGAGQDSTALLYKYIYDAEFRRRYAPRRFLVIFCETGVESPSTYLHLEDVKQLCARRHVPFAHVTPEMDGGRYYARSWRDLISHYERTETCGSRSGYSRSCTVNLKIVPFANYLEEWVGREYNLRGTRKQGLVAYARLYRKIRVIVGLARGEESRVADPADAPKWRQRSIETVYPLIDLGMDRADCQRYILSLGHPLPYPSHCLICHFTNEIGLLWLYRTHPDVYWKWVAIEARKIAKFARRGLAPKRNHGVFGARLLPDVLAEARLKYGHLTHEEIDRYKLSYGHCVRSKY